MIYNLFLQRKYIKKLSMYNSMKVIVHRQSIITIWIPRCQRTLLFVWSANMSIILFSHHSPTTDLYRKLSVLQRSFPIISLLSHLLSRLEKMIKLSSAASIIFDALFLSSNNLTSEISPSKTEFWTQFKYWRQSFSIFATRFSPQS